MILNIRLATLLSLVIFSGCTQVVSTVAEKVVGDKINDHEVEKKERELVGQPAAASDSMFGARLETLVDTRDPGRMAIIYPAKFDPLHRSHYVVELQNGRITDVTKTTRDPELAEDVAREADMHEKYIGKSAAECDASFGSPDLVMRSEETGEILRVYNVQTLSSLGSARYAVLRFDASGRCVKAELVGVAATTEAGTPMMS